MFKIHTKSNISVGSDTRNPGPDLTKELTLFFQKLKTPQTDTEEELAKTEKSNQFWLVSSKYWFYKPP